MKLAPADGPAAGSADPLPESMDASLLLGPGMDVEHARGKGGAHVNRVVSPPHQLFMFAKQLIAELLYSLVNERSFSNLLNLNIAIGNTHA